MPAISRVGPMEVLEKLSKRQAILVCAYEEEERFKKVHLHGAISMGQFLDRLPMIPNDTEVVFYCD